MTPDEEIHTMSDEQAPDEDAPKKRGRPKKEFVEPKQEKTRKAYLARCDWAGPGQTRRWKGSVVEVTADELFEAMDSPTPRYSKSPVKPLAAQARFDKDGYWAAMNAYIDSIDEDD